MATHTDPADIVELFEEGGLELPGALPAAPVPPPSVPSTIGPTPGLSPTDPVEFAPPAGLSGVPPIFQGQPSPSERPGGAGRAGGASGREPPTEGAGTLVATLFDTVLNGRN